MLPCFDPSQDGFLRALMHLVVQVLLSATMHEKLAQLASLSLHNHVSVGFRWVQCHWACGDSCHQDASRQYC